MSEPVAVLMGLCNSDPLPWVKEAVESVHRQDYSIGEIRIYLGVDGPLSEDVEQWLEQENRLFYRVRRNDKNIGLSKTLNLLIGELEQEQFIFRMDSDDISLPFRFSTQVGFLKAHPAIDMLGGSIWEFSAHQQRTSWKRSYPLTHDAIQRYIVKANPFAHGTVCFRRSFFEKAGLYPERYRYNQDLGLWYQALLSGVRMANLDTPVLCLRTSERFYRQRGYRRAWSELIYYLTGIWRLKGLSRSMIYPCARFLLRLLPGRVMRFLYQGWLRDWVRRSPA